MRWKIPYGKVSLRGECTSTPCVWCDVGVARKQCVDMLILFLGGKCKVGDESKLNIFYVGGVEHVWTISEIRTIDVHKPSHPGHKG
jgi:hypothetical protein